MREKADRQEKYNKIGKAVLHAAIVLYGLSMVFLFYKQAGWTDGSVYESDLPAHIKMIVEDGWYYSLTAFIYQAFYHIPFTLPGGVPAGNLAVAVFLALCGLLSVYLTAFLLRDMQTKQLSGPVRKDEAGISVQEKRLPGKAAKGTMERISRKSANRELTSLHLSGGLILNLVMPCYIRGIADGRYIGMESASIWHNSTYIVMKTMGLLCMLYYGKLAEKYRQGLAGKEWCCFTFLLSVCTAVKPSFLMVFAPVMAVFLLTDLLRRTPFWRVFAFGSVIFLPLFIVLFQNMILFGAETGNGWEIRPGYALSLHSGHPFVSAALSVLFPLILLPVFWKEFLKDRWFSGVWLMAAAGFLELFLFTETGGRAGDGNFMWGYSFSILMIFAAALVKWVETGERILREKKSKDHRFRVCVFVVSGLALCWHLYCGIYFYAKLVQGVSYWMWD